MSSSKNKVRGASKKFSISGNLTQPPYVTSGSTGDVQFRGSNGALDSRSSFKFSVTTSTLIVPFFSAKQIYTTKQTISVIGVGGPQIINLDNGSYIELDLTAASGTVTLTLTNGNAGGSYAIRVLQAATKVDVVLANLGRFDGETGSTIVGVNSQDYCIFPLYTGVGFLLNIAKLT